MILIYYTQRATIKMYTPITPTLKSLLVWHEMASKKRQHHHIMPSCLLNIALIHICLTGYLSESSTSGYQFKHAHQFIALCVYIKLNVVSLFTALGFIIQSLFCTIEIPKLQSFWGWTRIMPVICALKAQ